MGSGAFTSIPVSKHRMEALADGVFAIAMTLLVLEIKVPELPRSASPLEIWHSVAHEGPVFFSFFITFLLSGVFWYKHQSLLQHLKVVRGVLLPLNIAFLMFVSVLPFSTAMLGRYLRNVFAQEIYFGNQFALGILLVLQWRVALSQDLVADPNCAEAKQIPWMLARFPIGGALSMLVAFKSTVFSFWAFPIGALLVRAFQRRSRKKHTKASAA